VYFKDSAYKLCLIFWVLRLLIYDKVFLKVMQDIYSHLSCTLLILLHNFYGYISN